MPRRLRLGLLGAAIGLSAVSSALADPRDEALQGPGGYRLIVRREALLAHLPFEVADAVVTIESGYDPTKIGGVGEIGLMQIRPATAAMLGFKGTTAELAVPSTNIHFGVTYLAQAWRIANGDLCRVLMKYRAGHREETMSPLSVTYCGRARRYLASIGSPLSEGALPEATVAEAPRRSIRQAVTASSSVPKLNIRLKGAAFWAAQEARVRAITARVERRWKRYASR